MDKSCSRCGLEKSHNDGCAGCREKDATIQRLKEQLRVRGERMEKCYLHIALEQDTPDGFYDWFTDEGKCKDD